MSQPSDTTSPAQPAAKRARTPDSRSPAEQFTGLLSAASRLFHELSTRSPGRASGLGVDEWLVLSAVATSASGAKQLARDLGFTPQRTTQVIGTLKAAGRAIVAAEGEGAVSITAEGRSALTVVNEEITRVLSQGFKGKEKLVLRAEKAVKLLAKAFRDPSGGKAKGKDRPGRAERTAGKAARTAAPMAAPATGQQAAVASAPAAPKPDANERKSTKMADAKAVKAARSADVKAAKTEEKKAAKKAGLPPNAPKPAKEGRAGKPAGARVKPGRQDDD